MFTILPFNNPLVKVNIYYLQNLATKNKQLNFTSNTLNRIPLGKIKCILANNLKLNDSA